MLKKEYKEENKNTYIFDNRKEAIKKFIEIKKNILRNKDYFNSVNVIKSKNKFYVYSPACDFIGFWETELLFFYNC